MDENNMNMTPATDAAPQEQGKGLAIAALVLGIISIVLGCCYAYVGIILGALAIICAVLYKNKNGKMSGLAVGGLVCGIIGLAFGVISVIITAVFGAAVMEALQSMQ